MNNERDPLIRSEIQSQRQKKSKILDVKNLKVNYGHINALKGIDFEIFQGEIVCILGANGAGKTTILKAISHLIPYTDGNIVYKGKDLKNYAPDKIVRSGIVHVPEGRKIFPNLTVLENLKLATFSHKNDKKPLYQDLLQRSFTLFPILQERSKQYAGTLSGGEQQMLAIARALMTTGDLLLLDEPSMGLAPLIIQQIFEIIKDINKMGVTILLVEQNAKGALALADYGYVLETGVLSHEGEAEKLQDDPRVVEAYLG